MSALANSSSKNQTSQALVGHQSMLSNKSADINVTTRIDYNLRFTKQAVLVVAEHSEQYSALASQFLTTLSSGDIEGLSNKNHINVAFVSASSKLNDIQIRCRLIEQLFFKTLFDPEQSLAVSILRLAKEQGEDISIVIDHAHVISLQIKYELAQLVSLAKKNKLTINVVLFGLLEAAQQLTLNKSLFKGKMAVIDALTGQVLSLDDQRIIPSTNKSTFTYWHKLSLLVSLLLLAGTVFWLYELISTDINQQNNQKNELVKSSKVLSTVANEPEILSSGSVVRKMDKKTKIADMPPIVNNTTEATSEEINVAILTAAKQDDIKPVIAKANDVIQALIVDDLGQGSKVVSTEIPESKVIVNPLNTTKIRTVKAAVIDNNYYENQAVVHEQGYIYQIAGFTDKTLWQRFIEKYSTENLFSYQRLLNGQKFIVVTSKVYPSKESALIAMQLLPASLSERKPWVKAISSVINEINTLK